MQKYYTRACNFYFGKSSKQKIKKNLSLALNGNNSISFDSVEVISKTSKQILNVETKFVINLYLFIYKLEYFFETLFICVFF